jgi:hypothetical protein
MDWFIYIGGWCLGWPIINMLINSDNKLHKDGILIFKLVAWTMVWIWFCWRVIA